MTLTEWSQLNPSIIIDNSETGKGKIVRNYIDAFDYRRLWTLEDYVVSTANAYHLTLIPA